MVALSSIEARSIACAGSQISYLEAGSGAVVILLHGIGSAAASWTDQIAALTPHWRVIAWNAPGYGQSSPLGLANPVALDYANRLLAFAEALGLKRFHLVGHSLGSTIAGSFAARYPERLISLTLCSTALGHARLPAEERERLLKSRLDDLAQLGPRAMAEKRGPRLLGPDATDAMRQRVIETMASVDPIGYPEAARMLSAADLLADLSRLPSSLAVQIITGDADVITPVEANRKAAAMRPGAPLHLIAGAGHLPYIEKPEAFSALLRSFLERHHERP